MGTRSTQGEGDGVRVGGGDPSARPGEPEVAAARAVGRRRLLGGGAVAAAAAAAGVVAVSDRAGAADGGPVVIGVTNTGSSATKLFGSSLQVTGSNDTPRVVEVVSVTHDAAIYGTNSASFGRGVQGVTSASTGTGVDGLGNVGVSGSTLDTDGVGVRGSASESGATGIVGFHAGAGVAVRAVSFAGPAIQVIEGPLIPPGPSALPWSPGDVVRSGDHLWYCWKGGFAGGSEWSRLSSTLVVLDAPVRAYDSRPGFQPLGGAKGVLGTGVARTIDLAGTGVPAGASSVLVNLTATGTSAAGFLSAYRAGIAWPGTSSLNWSQVDANVANEVTVKLSADGKIVVRCGGTGASTHVVVDVVGYRS